MLAAASEHTPSPLQFSKLTRIMLVARRGNRVSPGRRFPVFPGFRGNGPKPRKTGPPGGTTGSLLGESEPPFPDSRSHSPIRPRTGMGFPARGAKGRGLRGLPVTGATGPGAGVQVRVGPPSQCGAWLSDSVVTVRARYCGTGIMMLTFPRVSSHHRDEPERYG
jgi:hypothetical protein